MSGRDIVSTAMRLASEHVANAAAKAECEPTAAQKTSGNYRKGHVMIHGMDITIENAKGSLRCGQSENGEQWKVEMPCHYGYIRRISKKP